MLLNVPLSRVSVVAVDGGGTGQRGAAKPISITLGLGTARVQVEAYADEHVALGLVAGASAAEALVALRAGPVIALLDGACSDYHKRDVVKLRALLPATQVPQSVPQPAQKGCKSRASALIAVG